MSGRVPETFAVYGFATTHDAIAAEDLTRDAGVAVTAIPSPASLGSLCGIALRVRVADAGALEAALTLGGRPWTAQAVIEDV